MATGADSVFITQDRGLVEPERMLPLALAAAKRTQSLDFSKHFLTNPWNTQGLVPLNDYPRLRAYLETHSMRLRDRYVGKRSTMGWYRTIDRVDPQLLTTPKLDLADIKDRLTPVRDQGTTYSHYNLY